MSELEARVKEIHKTKNLLNELLRELVQVHGEVEVRMEIQDVVDQKYQQVEISVMQEIYP